ncbi:hypothetical protein FHS92_000645 [Sphingobium subterraneum]|uniref:Uncharacterized protein n=1 Tax=Sphingobium subterraneum TaxID=627688 RepID=A0A841J354_9SPHN|nr:hypothetical protein [Sphingobium subterraneum]
MTIAYAAEKERVMILDLFYGGQDWETIMDAE